MSKVFVSYKRVDKDKVFPLVHKMESDLGIEFWVDLDGIKSDEQFSSVIVDAINECEVFLFMFSKAHEKINPKKDWTVREITFADEKEKRIVFVALDGIKLPDWFLFTFPHKQVIQANDNLAMGHLVEDIREWLRLPQPNLSPSHSGKTTDKVSVPTENPSHPQTEKTTAEKPHPQAIDLGLPSGTKWASCNVGASKPEEYGGYYAWGETKEKSTYNWTTYKHCDGSRDTCHNLGSDIAGTKYDVAHMKWGGNWRMPTKEQFDELLRFCLYEWTTLNGVKGYKFTSKINLNSIFLPAAGNRWDDYLGDAGLYGYYWSSTQSPSYSYLAYYLNFLSGSAYWDSSRRGIGRTVRPVSII